MEKESKSHREKERERGLTCLQSNVPSVRIHRAHVAAATACHNTHSKMGTGEFVAAAKKNDKKKEAIQCGAGSIRHFFMCSEHLNSKHLTPEAADLNFLPFIGFLPDSSFSR